MVKDLLEYLSFGLYLKGIIQLLPVTSATFAEVRAGRIHAPGSGFENPDYFSSDKL